MRNAWGWKRYKNTGKHLSITQMAKPKHKVTRGVRGGGRRIRAKPAAVAVVKSNAKSEAVAVVHEEGFEGIEHKFEDAFFGFLLLASIAMLVLVLISEGWFSESWAKPMVSGLSLAAFPLLVVFIVLSIGRELWIIRSYFDHIHISEVINERI